MEGREDRPSVETFAKQEEIISSVLCGEKSEANSGNGGKLNQESEKRKKIGQE